MNRLTKEREHAIRQINERALRVGGPSSDWEIYELLTEIGALRSEILEMAKPVPVYMSDFLHKVEKERDHYKSEYENVCKFANDYEAQRDQLKLRVEKLRESLAICLAALNAIGFEV